MPDTLHPSIVRLHPQDEQYVLLIRYGATLARVNHPRAFFIGVPGKTPGLLTVTLHTYEINLQGYWTFVQRTVHLHASELIITYNIIGPSTVFAARDPDNSLRANMLTTVRVTLFIRLPSSMLSLATLVHDTPRSNGGLQRLITLDVYPFAIWLAFLIWIYASSE